MKRSGILFALAAALSGFTILRGIGPHDEGLMLQAASRIGAGQWPYRDFWLNYPPGQPALLALLGKLFGAPLLTWRVLRVGLDATVSVLAYRLVRREAPEPLALAAWAAVAGAMAFPTGPGPNPPALALALGALLAARRAPLAAGAIAGLAVPFRLEIGAAAVLGVWIAGRRGRSVLVGVAVAALALAPFFAVDPGSMLSDTVGFLGIQGLQRLPFPLHFHGALRPSKLIEFYFPAILIAGTACWLLGAMPLIRRALASPRYALASAGGDLALAPLALVGVGYLLGRTDEFHLIPLSVALSVMLAIAIPRPGYRAVRVLLIGALALIAIHGIERRAGQALHPPALAAVPGGDGVETSPDDARALTELRHYVWANTTPGESIFVANPRHDLVRFGESLLYVILDRPNATRYISMQPGVMTTAKVQREIVSSLARVRLVVRWLDPAAAFAEPNGAGRSSGVHILDLYLASQFREVARFGYYAVLRRRA